jgi:hypothetical protein
MAKTGFDTSVFQREMSRVFNDYRQLNKRALPEILRNRAIALAIGSGKGAKYKGLYQEARALRSMVRAEIQALPKKLNWRIKRFAGTVKAEIARRQVQAGYFQASGWLVPGLIDISGEGSQVKTVRGQVSMQLNGNKPSITLTNTSPNAREYGNRTGYISRALYNQTQDMLVYIQKHLDLTVQEFNKKYPNFRTPIENFMPD